MSVYQFPAALYAPGRAVRAPVSSPFGRRAAIEPRMPHASSALVRGILLARFQDVVWGAAMLNTRYNGFGAPLPLWISMIDRSAFELISA